MVPGFPGTTLQALTVAQVRAAVANEVLALFAYGETMLDQTLQRVALGVRAQRTATVVVRGHRKFYEDLVAVPARREITMPKRRTIERSRRDAKQGKSRTTQAGEFVREEMKHIREGKHGARSTKQAIAIGLSKARRAGVKLPPPGNKSSPQTRRKAEQDSAAAGKPRSTKRSRATLTALKRESKKAASPKSLSKQTRTAARNRTAEQRSNAARKAARTRKRSI